MKKMRIWGLCLILCILSFLGGTFISKKKMINQRQMRCETYLSFAFDKIEEHKKKAQEVIAKGLASNIYTAYELCDHSQAKSILHDCWNQFIHDESISKEDLEKVENQLSIVLEMMNQ